MGPSRSTVDGEQVRQFRLLGTGTTPTVQVGTECTVTRVSQGLYRLTFTDGPGTFVAVRGYMFGAETPGDVKGQTCTRDTYTAPTATADGFLDIAIWSSTFAADDLQATEYLDLSLVFQV